jgi:hypothetical protein
MKAGKVVPVLTWLYLCINSVAAEPTNTPNRVTICQFSRPPMDRIIVTSTNMIGRIMNAFPGYREQPADGFSIGHWPTEYIVNVDFPDGHGRTIYVAANKWTAGADKYIPLTLRWDDLLLSMTTNFFKKDWANMERLGNLHEATTLIVGPSEMTSGLRTDMKGQ